MKTKDECLAKALQHRELEGKHRRLALEDLLTYRVFWDIDHTKRAKAHRAQYRYWARRAEFWEAYNALEA